MNQEKGYMKRIGSKLILGLLFTLTGVVQAALPPQYQNAKDLEVIVEYIKSNEEVMSGLQAIDLGSMTVYYGDGCSARFARQFEDRPAGWVGPAAALEFIEASCPEAGPILGEAEDIGGITSRDTSACGMEIKEEEACE